MYRMLVVGIRMGRFGLVDFEYSLFAEYAKMIEYWYGIVHTPMDDIDRLKIDRLV